MGRLDLRDKPRDEDSSTFWSSDASRALARGDYAGAIAMLVELGHEVRVAEEVVAMQLAVNTPVPIRGARLLFLVETARRVMDMRDWTFELVASAVEAAQAKLGETAA